MADSLTARVTGFLERQRYWLHDARQELNQTAPAPGEAWSATAEAVSTRISRELASTVREFNGLLAEWQAAQDVESADRDAVHALALEVESEKMRLLETIENAARRTAAAVSALGPLRQSLHTGRQLLQRYRPGGDDAPGYVDRKA